MVFSCDSALMTLYLNFCFIRTKHLDKPPLNPLGLDLGDKDGAFHCSFYYSVYLHHFLKAFLQFLYDHTHFPLSDPPPPLCGLWLI